MRRFALLSLFLILVFSVRAQAEPVHSFTIIQLNDVYEVLPVAVDGGAHKLGGLAYAGTLIQQARRRGPVLVLHAGDFLSPSLLSQKLKHKGSQMIDAMNALHIGMVTFGNHEFDMGCQVLADRMKQSKFAWVSANVDLPAAMNLPPGKVRPYYVIQVAGLKVGIFGLTVPLQPITGCGDTPITFRDPLVTAQQIVPKLKKQGVDLIIALTHLRIDQDQEIAATLPDIDLTVGGHEHEVIVTTVGKTLITKAGANALGLGLVGVRAVRTDQGWVVEKRWNRETVDPSTVKASPRISAVLAPYEKEMEPFSEVIGETLVPLDIREETVRESESNLGDYIADIMRAEMQTDVALLNGGSFRDDRIIPAGKITLADLYTMMPFQNQLLAVEITGEQLAAALENGVSLAGDAAGRFPQISGMSFKFDPGKPVGQRVSAMQIGGTPPDPQKLYTLAATDFLVNHGTIDGYKLPQKALKTGGDLNELIVASLRKGPISPVIEKRIVEE
jgi:5'-nucleotidase